MGKIDFGGPRLEKLKTLHALSLPLPHENSATTIIIGADF